MDTVEGKEVVWSNDEQTLSDVLNKFKLPVLVKVVQGFIVNENECLDNNTILTIHGQRRLMKISAKDELDRELNIPVDCKYLVTVRPYSAEKVYTTIRDVCEEEQLPHCIQNTKKFAYYDVVFAAGTNFRVRSVCYDSSKIPEGLSVISFGEKALRIKLSMAIRGHFREVQIPTDKNQPFLIKNLLDRHLPMCVEFLPTEELDPPYNPSMGRVRLKKQYATDIVFGTSYVDGKKHLITISREIEIKLQIGRDYSEEYQTIAELTEDSINPDALKYLLYSYPFSGDYNTVSYSEIKEKVKQSMLTKADSCYAKPVARNKYQIVPPKNDKYDRKNYQIVPQHHAKYDSFGRMKTETSAEASQKTLENIYYDFTQDKEVEEIICTKKEDDTKKQRGDKNNKSLHIYAEIQGSTIRDHQKQRYQKAAKAYCAQDTSSKSKAYCAQDTSSKSKAYYTQDTSSKSNAAEESKELPQKFVGMVKLSEKNVLHEMCRKNIKEIIGILGELQLNAFADEFESMLIDGALLAEIDENDLANDLKMSLFQARKLQLYIRGWKPNANTILYEDMKKINKKSKKPNINSKTDKKKSTMRNKYSNMLDRQLRMSKGWTSFQTEKSMPTEITDSYEKLDIKGRDSGINEDEEYTNFQNLPETWADEEVYERMTSINLPSFAEFCFKNQVNGKLLLNIIDKEILDSIRHNHDVELSRIQEKKLRNYVIDGWRPNN